MKQKVTKDNWEALIHWNFALVGGFLGAYAILLHMGNFGSAQTGNIMEMAASLVSGEWYDVLLRFLALPLFGGGVVISYLLTNYTNINMRKLAIVVDAAGLVASSLLPLQPVLVGLYPIFFCSAFITFFSSSDFFSSFFPSDSEVFSVFVVLSAFVHAVIPIASIIANIPAVMIRFFTFSVPPFLLFFYDYE